MNAKYVGLALVTLAVIALAWKVSEDKAPQTEVMRSSLYPHLTDRLNDIGRVRLKSGEHETILVRKDDAWKVENRDGFPAAFTGVKRAVLQIADLEIVEAKTAIAANYPRIGVADIDADDADGTLVELETDANETIAALLIGKPEDTAAQKQRYVRKVGDPQSWLVKGDLEIAADTLKWLETELTDVDTNRVKQVSIMPREGETILISKSDSAKNFFELANIPDGFKAKSKATISSIGAILLSLKFDDVAAASIVNQLTPVRQVELQTFDGMIGKIDVFELDERALVRFGFSFDPELIESRESEDRGDDGAGENPEAGAGGAESEKSGDESVADEVARLERRTSGWVYELPDYKMRMIGKRFEDLIEEIEPADDPEQG